MITFLLEGSLERVETMFCLVLKDNSPSSGRKEWEFEPEEQHEQKLGAWPVGR